MSLFDDDFYSSKVSRRARRETLGEVRRQFRSRTSRDHWSMVRIAFISSITSAIAACILFGLIFGFGSNSSDNKEGLNGYDPSVRTIQASAKVRPAVVSIINEQKFSLTRGNEILERDIESNGVYREAGVGSGVIFEKQDNKAYIVTNYHVIHGAERLKAVLSNGEIIEAKVIGSDQITDLAVLEIDGSTIETIAELGDSSLLQPAEFVIAIGNPLGMGESITMGVVSVAQETVAVSLNQNGIYDWEQEVIRVDAAINQGNSGGPLIDLNGKVVGINSMKIASASVDSIGYAIPINNALPVVRELMEHGYVSRPYLGVYMLDLEEYWNQKEFDKMLDPEGKSSSSEIKLPASVLSGVIVLEALGPSKEAGLQFNDVIVKLDDTKIGSTRELRKYLYEHKSIGDEVKVEFYRNSKLESVTITLSENSPE